MSIYKKFTAQDFAIVPFNAHKQYDFDQNQAATNQVTYLTSSWTSESIDIYSSASNTNYGLPVDHINTVKYFQLDHLFYKNFKKDINNRFGNIHYLNQKRELYEKVNILSIPSGLYGFEVKPGSFYLDFLGNKVVDDLNGNLIISGTNINNYPIDIRSNIFKLDPIKGFRNYDLNTFEGYAIPFENDGNVRGSFWRDGKSKVNFTDNYSSPDQGEYDDSYFFNPIKYNNVTFTTSSISLTNSYFTNINFNSKLGSNIISPDNEKFDLNQNEDFAISFNVIPEALTQPKVGDYIQGGFVFHVSGAYAYVVADEPIIRLNTPQSDNNWSSMNNVPASFVPGTDNTNYTNLTPTISDGFTATDYLMGTTTSSLEFRDIGGGETNTLAWKATENFVQANQPLFPIVQATLDYNYNGFNDWWIPNYDEWEEIIESLYTEKGSFPTILGNDISDIEGKEDLLGIYPLLKGEGELSTVSPNDSFKVPLSNNHPTDSDNILGVSPFIDILHSNWTSTPGERQHSPVNIPIFDNSTSNYVIWPVRKFSIGETLDNKQRHIISKSTTKTTILTPIEGQAQLLKTNVEGSSQFVDIMAQPQFPFEIYMVSQSLYFDRSDGEIISSLNILITGSNNFTVNNNAHILCQKSGSDMEIYFNGNLITSSVDATIKQTQNEANIYIGSKGILSETEETNNTNFSFFNGKLGNINIFENSFNAATVTNISESVNGSPYIGNMFYQNGFATITHPKYNDILLEGGAGGQANEVINGNFVETFGTPELLTSGSLLFPVGPEEVDLSGPIVIETDLVSTVLIGPLTPDNISVDITFTGFDDDSASYIQSITPNNLENGKTYTFSYKLTGFTDRIGLLGGGASSYQVFADGTYSGTFISDGTKPHIYVEYDGTNPVVGTMSNISIKEDVILKDDFGDDIFPLELNGNDFEYLPGGQFKITNNTGGGKSYTLRQKDLGLTVGKFYTIKVVIAATGGLLGNLDLKNQSKTVASTTSLNSRIVLSTNGQNFNSPFTAYFTFKAESTFSGGADMRIGSFLPNERSITFESISMKESLSNWDFDDLNVNTVAGHDVINQFSNNLFDNFILNMDGNNANTATNPVLSQTLNNLEIGSTYKIEWDLNGGSWKFHVSEDILANSYASTPIQTTNGSLTFVANDPSVIFYIEAVIIDQEFLINFPNSISITNTTELKQIQFQGSHLIYEHEYQCTVEESEFNDTTNITARKIKSNKSPDLANFTTSSLFKPYVTTVGLYNEDHELLVVGKLGQPIRTSDETDTTFVLRWDT